MPPLGLVQNINFRGPSGGGGGLPPSPPQNVSAQAGNEQVDVSWDALDPEPEGGYQVYYSETNDFEFALQSSPVASPSDTSHIILGTINGTLYYVWVVAINGNGESDPSEVITTFSPASIAGLKLWLKGNGVAYNTGTTQATDGQTVETWVDSSGQGNNATQATGIRRPVFKDIGGVKSLLTAGTEWMDTTWNAGSTCSIFVVYKNSGTTNGRWVSGGNNWLLGPYSFNYSYYSNTGFAGGSTSSNGNTSIRLHNAVQTSSGGQHWLNGVSQGTVGSAGAPGIISAPGTYLSGGELGSGHIYEVIGYDSALSESDRQLVENYLLTKYGI